MHQHRQRNTERLIVYRLTGQVMPPIWDGSDRRKADTKDRDKHGRNGKQTLTAW